MKKILIGFLVSVSSLPTFSSCFPWSLGFSHKGGAIVEMRSLLSGHSTQSTALIQKDRNIGSRFLVTQVVSNQLAKCQFGEVVAESGNIYCKFKRNLLFDSYHLLSIANKCLLVTEAGNGSLYPLYEISGSEGNSSVLSRIFLKNMNSEIDSDEWKKIDSVSLED